MKFFVAFFFAKQRKLKTFFYFFNLDGPLSCKADGMSVTLNAAKFNKHGRSFTFGFKDSDDSACSSADNTADEVVLSANFNQCGIVTTVEDGAIKYSQTLYVTYGVNPASALIYREETITFDVECVQSTNVAAALDGEYVNVTALKNKLSLNVRKRFFMFSFKSI